MFFDAHCHLDFEHFDSDRNEVVERAAKQDVRIINSGIDSKSIEKSLRLAREYENVYCTLGHQASELDPKKVEKDLRMIEENLDHDKVLGVGEVGLDYYWVKKADERKRQEKQFLGFVELAKEHDLPLVIHSRDAEKRVLQILEKEDLAVMLHCFDGGPKYVKKALDLGFLISMPTNIAYSKRKKQIAEAVPLKQMVLETDAPFLAPTQKKRNEPLNVKESAEIIAGIKETTIKEVEQKTTRNIRSLFNNL